MYGEVADRERRRGKGFAGGIAMQKYEAYRNIAQHLSNINRTSPTQETSGWRVPRPGYAFGKQKGRLVQQEQVINRDNKFINSRLINIVGENRANIKSEGFSPGWRIGQGTD
jgi:hypothetical protein